MRNAERRPRVVSACIPLPASSRDLVRYFSTEVTTEFIVSNTSEASINENVQAARSKMGVQLVTGNPKKVR